MKLTRKWPITLGFVVALGAMNLGCSSSGGGGGAGTGGSSGSGGGSATGGSGGSTAPDAGGGTLAAYKTCTNANRVGRFTASINNDAENPYSGVQGYVMDGVEPVGATRTIGTVGACTILQPAPQGQCNPACPAEQWCTASGCKPMPNPKDVGTVTVAGLKQPLQLEKVSNSYGPPASTPLMHPVFADGADITLSASGAQGFGPSPCGARAWRRSSRPRIRSRPRPESR